MKKPGTILLVDDEPAFRENVAERLRSRDFTVLEAGDGETALAEAQARPVDVALVDLLMPGMDGLAVLEGLKELDPLVEVIIVTGAGSIENAVKAIQEGAFHYVTKPVRLGELEITVRRALEKSRLARQNEAYRENIGRGRPRLPGLLAHASPVMARILAEAEKLAGLDAPVLIEGETGTGKELVAELIHERSRRSGRPLMVLNCGALSESLVDAELFGHEKGAFTGATETRPGMVEASDEGTLLLDEIGDIPGAAQVRLLRFLERGVFRKVGSSREQVVDVRILAATHQDLEVAVQEGRFREDLFHRLNVFRLQVPPLRERAEDIPLLAEHFRKSLPGGEGLPFTTQAEEALATYPWPGNVRELAHAVERALFAASLEGSAAVERKHFSFPGTSGRKHALVSLKEAEELHVCSVLDAVSGNRPKAAEVLGISERHLYRLLKKYRDKEPPATD